MQIKTDSKLIRVRATKLNSGKTRYIGYFADGTVSTLRESFNTYASICQLAPFPGEPTWVKSGQQEFRFSRKPGTACLSSLERSRLVACVHVGSTE
jgi:hypothetical protein